MALCSIKHCPYNEESHTCPHYPKCKSKDKFNHCSYMYHTNQFHAKSMVVKHKGGHFKFLHFFLPTHFEYMPQGSHSPFINPTKIPPASHVSLDRLQTLFQQKTAAS